MEPFTQDGASRTRILIHSKVQLVCRQKLNLCLYCTPSQIHSQNSCIRAKLEPNTCTWCELVLRYLFCHCIKSSYSRDRHNICMILIANHFHLRIISVFTTSSNYQPSNLDQVHHHLHTSQKCKSLASFQKYKLLKFSKIESIQQLCDFHR